MRILLIEDEVPISKVVEQDRHETRPARGLPLAHRWQPGVVAARGLLELGVGNVKVVDGGDVLALPLRLNLFPEVIHGIAKV